MIDANRLLTDEKEYIKEAIARKGYDVSKIDELAEITKELKDKRTEIDELRHKRNVIQKDRNVPVDEKRALRAQINEEEEKLNELTQKSKDLLLDIPNLPDEAAPDGLSAEDNVIIAESINNYKNDLKNPLPHWDIGKNLDILDIDLATKLSGSMFSLFKGDGGKLVRALVNYCFDLNEDTYDEFLPPHLVTTQSLTYTGHLPKFADDQYKMLKDDLWLIPTAEVPLTASFANTTYNKEDLPQKRMAYTVAFRREAGSSGADTRGLQRLHEFHKVELLKIVAPEQLDKELSTLLEDCIRIINDLGLEYRIVDLCAGDMGDKYGRCFDIEVYAPGSDRWLEVSSIGHFSDYQARRSNIKFKDDDGRKKLVYTMNGSGMAIPRVFAAILETYQQEDGSVLIPEVLQPFMGKEKIEKK